MRVVQACPSPCVMLQSLFLQSRRIVVRELNGILREATWEERDRMCQVENVTADCLSTIPLVWY